MRLIWNPTSLEPNFLEATLSNARSRGIDERRIQVGVANISTPHLITKFVDEPMTLDDVSFGIICVGAVLGYAEDTENSIRQLVDMLIPGGVLINIEKNESPAGRFVSRRYHYCNISLSRMQDILRDAGCVVTATRLSTGTCPQNSPGPPLSPGNHIEVSTTRFQTAPREQQR